jgi:hypothetical protein
MAGRKLVKFCMDIMPRMTNKKLIVFNFLHSEKPTRELLEVMRWNDDYAIAYDPLRMRITNLTWPNLTKTHSFTRDTRLHEFH